MRNAVWLTALLAVACGGGSNTGTGPNDSYPASMVALSAITQSGVVGAEAGEGAVVLVKDQYGNVLRGARIDWTLTAGAGTVSGGATTGPDGTARVSWTFGTVAGANTLEARLHGLPTIAFTAMAAPGSSVGLGTVPASLDFDRPMETLQLAAAMVDQYGNGVSAVAATWSTSNSSVVTVDGEGWVTVVGGGSATITATAAGASAQAPVAVDMPVFSALWLDLDDIVSLDAFGEPLSAVHDNVAYEVRTHDFGMPVYSASAGTVERVIYLPDTDDYALHVRFSETWLVIYDHMIAPTVTAGALLEAGAMIGGVGPYGYYQPEHELLPQGRIELQINYEGAREPAGMAWCPALFGTAEFNTAHDAAFARARSVGSLATSTCTKVKAQP